MPAVRGRRSVTVLQTVSNGQASVYQNWYSTRI